MTKRTHSEKALTTLAQMDTQPTEWALTPIRWVKEERMVPGEVTCPTCQGLRVVLLKDGQPVPAPKLPERPATTALYGSAEWSAYAKSKAYRAYEKARAALSEYELAASAAAGEKRWDGNCPTCARPRGRGWAALRSTGRVKGLVLAEVLVGYPEFPKGTRFDSRFGHGDNCHLCAKNIKSDRRVPVNTDGAKPHGMWVGEDCAKKFLGVKIKRQADSIMEDGR